MTDQPSNSPLGTAPPSRTGARVWVALHLLALGALAVGVVYGLRIRCESFGCVGLGIYWFGWACVYGVAGLLGLWARSRSLRAGVAVGLVRVALWVQLLMGLGLLFWWWLG